MKDSDSNKMRPIDAFIKYFLDVKPFHTELLEVVERYKFAEDMPVDITDSMFTTVAYRNNPLCKAVGFGLIFDECGFSNDNCCDLFQCLGGYGVIWDNSDLIGVHPILATNQTTDEIEVAGNFTFDRRLEILKVEEHSLTLRGNWTDEFLFHKLFLIAPFNVYSIESANSNTLSIYGDVAAELTAKREIKVNGTAGRDGLYGVNTAQYNPETGLTVVTVAGSANFSINVNGAYIETETQPRNQGFYPVDRAELVNGNTVVFLKTGYAFPVETNSDNGSVQLRTALSAPRRIWLSGSDTEREYRVADAFYDVTNDRTHIVLADRLFTGEAYNDARLYGYLTSSGFDNDEECDMPKPTNIHAVIGETLKITMRKAGTFSTNFDYAVLRYKWNTQNGQDLDTRTAIAIPGIFEDVGWARSSSTQHLTWAADNTSSSGAEGVLIDFKQLKQDYPGLSYFEVRLRNFWYNTVADGFYDVEFTMYRGGEMVKEGTDWVNYDGVEISTISRRGRNFLNQSDDIDGADVGFLQFDTLNNTGSLVIYPLPSAPAAVSMTPTPTATPTPTPTKTPAASAPFYEKYMYFTSEKNLGTPGTEVSVGYGKVTGSSGVQMLASHQDTMLPLGSTAYMAGQSTIYNDVIYVAHGKHLSVYKYANNTLEEVQTIQAPDPAGFTTTGGLTLQSSAIKGLDIDRTNGIIYLSIDLQRSVSNDNASKTVLTWGTIGPDGLITITLDTPVLVAEAYRGYYGSSSTSYVYIKDDLLVCSAIQLTYPSADSTGRHVLFTLGANGVPTLVNSVTAMGAQYSSGVSGHDFTVFEGAPNAIWAYSFTSAGINAPAYTGASSGLGFRVYGENFSPYTLPDGRVRLIGTYQRAFNSGTLDTIDLDLTTGANTASFTSVSDSTGRYAISYGAVKVDYTNGKVILFDAADTRESPTRSAPYANFDFTASPLAASVTAISITDNVIPFGGSVKTLQLLDSPLATFAITPTPTATVSVTPTPTPTITLTPTPSPSYGTVQPVVSSVQTGLLGSAGLTPVVENVSSDDTSYPITLPFNFQFFGSDYGVGNNGGLYVGTNSYLTAGVGSNAYSSLSATNPGKGILVSARDNRILSLYSGLQDGGLSFRIRYEGNDWYEQNTINISWELTFYKNSNLVQLVTGPRLGSGSTGVGISGISNGVTFQPQTVFAAGKSYVLQSDATGANWTITEGSVNLPNFGTPTPSVTGTLTPTPTPTVTVSTTATPTPTPSPTLTPTPTASPVFGNSIYNKIVAWWEFDENDTESRYVDVHGNHTLKTFAPSSSYYSADSKTGNAAKMPAIGTGLLVPRSDTTFDFTNNALSFAGWTKMHSTGGNTIQLLGKAQGARTNVDYLLQVSDDGSGAYSASTSPFGGSGKFYANQWHFFHMWHDPAVTNTAGLRIDMQTWGNSGTLPALTNTAGCNFSLGGEAQNDAMGGGYSPYTFGQASFDSLACFSAPLTDGEYRWLYNAGQGRTYLEVRNYTANPTPLSPTPTTTSTPTPTPTATRTPTPTVTPTLSITPTPSVAVTPFGLTDDGYVPPEGDVDVDF